MIPLGSAERLVYTPQAYLETRADVAELVDAQR
jgi:hypothetical protein